MKSHKSTVRGREHRRIGQQQSVGAAGFTCPAWEDLSTGVVDTAPLQDEDPNQPRDGCAVESSERGRVAVLSRCSGKFS